MKKYIYVIYDVKAEAYNVPFFEKNDQIVQRMCHDILTDPQSAIPRHPEDFTLFKIGEYEDETATIIMYETKTPLVHFHEMKAVLENYNTQGE